MIERRKHWAWIAAGVAVLVLTGPAVGRAGDTLIVDTGPGASSGGLTLSPNQWLAARFDLDQTTTITAIEGWMVYLNITASLPVHIVLYDGGIGPANKVLEQQFSLLPSGFAPGWNGIDGFAVEVGPGEHWVTFEVRNPLAVGSGAMPPTPSSVLPNYGLWTPGGGWVNAPTANVGVRIRGALEVPLSGASRWGIAAALVALGAASLRAGARRALSRALAS